jgi:hypothetical protein
LDNFFRGIGIRVNNHAAHFLNKLTYLSLIGNVTSIENISTTAYKNESIFFEKFSKPIAECKPLILEICMEFKADVLRM